MNMQQENKVKLKISLRELLAPLVNKLETEAGFTIKTLSIDNEVDTSNQCLAYSSYWLATTFANIYINIEASKLINPQDLQQTITESIRNITLQL